MFAAPPRTGSVAGPTRAVAVNGLAIRFPGLRLEFPTLEFPGLTRYRQNAHMRLDSATAPYMASPYPALAMRGASSTAPRDAGTSDREGPPAKCSRDQGDKGVSRDTRDADYEARVKRLQEAEACLKTQMQKVQECMDQFERAQRQSRRADTGPEIPTPTPDNSRNAMPPYLPPVAVADENPVRRSSYVAPAEPKSFSTRTVMRRLPPVDVVDDRR